MYARVLLWSTVVIKGAGGAEGSLSPNRNATYDKNDDTKPFVSSVSVSFSIFCVQQYMHATANGNLININNQGAPSIYCQSI